MHILHDNYTVGENGHLYVGGCDTVALAEKYGTPLDLIWEDGRHYPIDRILDVRRAASLKAGGAGIRYTVQIGRCKRFLYYDQPQWFVEGKD